MTASTLVSFRHVRKSWQQVTALQNFSLDIAAGELVVLVGSSGCGKSTLLRMLIGLEPVTQGEIRINGEPVRGVGKERGIVFQEPRLFPWLTVIDNVMLGLADEKLSRGVKRQRVAIARGLIASPQILMLDEPFGALDALTRHILQQELLHIHRSAGTTTLLVTHDVEEAVALADRVVVLSPRPGRIREVVTLALPHPRQRDDELFSAACRQIRNLITCA
ncbi:TPA: ABC transporter ATP-binding protein [Raoultella planticola]